MDTQTSSVATAIKTILNPSKATGDVVDALYVTKVRQLRSDYLIKLRVDAEIFRDHISNEIKELIDIVEVRDNILKQLQEVLHRKSQLEEAIKTGVVPEEIKPLVSTFEKSLQSKFIQAVLQSITNIETEYTLQHVEVVENIRNRTEEAKLHIEQSDYINPNDSSNIIRLIKESCSQTLSSALDLIKIIEVPLDSIRKDYTQSIAKLINETDLAIPMIRQDVMSEADAKLQTSIVGNLCRILIDVLRISADTALDQSDSLHRYDIYSPLLIDKLMQISADISIVEWNSSINELLEDQDLTTELSKVDDALWFAFKNAHSYCAQYNKEQITSLFHKIPISGEYCCDYLQNAKVNEVIARISTISKVFPTDLKAKISPSFIKALLESTEDTFYNYLPRLSELSKIISEDLIDSDISDALTKIESLAELDELLILANSYSRIEKAKFNRECEDIIPVVQSLLTENKLSIDYSTSIVYVFGFLYPEQCPNGIKLTQLSEKLPGINRKTVKIALENLIQIGLVTKESSKDKFRLSFEHSQSLIHTQILSTISPEQELIVPIESNPKSATQANLSVKEELEKFFEERKEIFRILILRAVMTNTAILDKTDPILANAVKSATVELMGETKEEQRKSGQQIFSKYRSISQVHLIREDFRPYYIACNKEIGKYYKSLESRVDRLLEMIEQDDPDLYTQQYQQLNSIKAFIQNPKEAVAQFADQYKSATELKTRYPNIDLANDELVAVGISQQYKLILPQ